jgi:hypothetical protein
LDGTAFVTTLGIDTIIKADIILLKKPIADQIKEKAADLSKILELNEIYFDMNKSNIRGDAKLELDTMGSDFESYDAHELLAAIGVKKEEAESKSGQELIEKKISVTNSL